MPHLRFASTTLAQMSICMAVTVMQANRNLPYAQSGAAVALVLGGIGAYFAMTQKEGKQKATPEPQPTEQQR